jgi:hypothetical protein
MVGFSENNSYILWWIIITSSFFPSFFSGDTLFNGKNWLTGKIRQIYQIHQIQDTNPSKSYG